MSTAIIVTLEQQRYLSSWIPYVFHSFGSAQTSCSYIHVRVKGWQRYATTSSRTPLHFSPAASSDNRPRGSGHVFQVAMYLRSTHEKTTGTLFLQVQCLSGRYVAKKTGKQHGPGGHPPPFAYRHRCGGFPYPLSLTRVLYDEPLSGSTCPRSCPVFSNYKYRTFGLQNLQSPPVVTIPHAKCHMPHATSLVLVRFTITVEGL